MTIPVERRKAGQGLWVVMKGGKYLDAWNNWSPNYADAWLFGGIQWCIDPLKHAWDFADARPGSRVVEVTDDMRNGINPSTQEAPRP